MRSSTALLVLAASVSGTLFRRDATTILNDIAAIKTNIDALSSSVNAYNGGLQNALPIQAATTTLDTSVQQGITDAKASSQLSSSDSSSVLSASNALVPEIKSSIDATVSKKDHFDTDGVTPVVLSSLNTLSTDTDSFSDALIAIAADGDKAQASSIKATIDGYFSSALTVLNGQSAPATTSGAAAPTGGASSSGSGATTPAATPAASSTHTESPAEITGNAANRAGAAGGLLGAAVAVAALAM